MEKIVQIDNLEINLEGMEANLSVAIFHVTYSCTNRIGEFALWC